jgi:type IV pilus assembly protein PilV
MTARALTPSPARRRQRGLVMVEALISILLLSVGVVGLLRLQSAAVTLAQDAKNRADAAFLADQIVGTIWADKRSARASYAHQPGGGDCSFSGTASTNDRVTAWIGNGAAGTVSGMLPQTGSGQQIVVDGDKVTVRLCWKAHRDAPQHKYVLVTKIAGGL